MSNARNHLESLFAQMHESQLREQLHKEEKAKHEAEIARIMLEHVTKHLELPDVPGWKT
jgi:hypothetical protein